MNAVADVIAMLEAARADADREIRHLRLDIEVREWRMRSLGSAIDAVRWVDARNRAASAKEGPHPDPLPRAGEGEEIAAERAGGERNSAVDAEFPAGPEGAADASIQEVAGAIAAAETAEAAAPPSGADEGGDVIAALIKAIDAAPAETAAADPAGEGESSPRHSPAKGEEAPEPEGEGGAIGGTDMGAPALVAVAMPEAVPRFVVAELPPATPARPDPAYQGVGLKKPALGQPAPGEAVALPLVDDRPAAPAVSGYLSEGQRLADRILAEFGELMQDYPEGPTVRQLSERYEAPASRVRDALRRLQDARKASVHPRRSTGFQHLMPFGARP